MHSDKLEQEIARVVQSVNEWDDRTSPDDYPEHLLITSEELADILRDFADKVRVSAVDSVVHLICDQASAMAEMAVGGLPENSRNREAMEAALTKMAHIIRASRAVVAGVNGPGSNRETLERVCLNDPDNVPKNENIDSGIELAARFVEQRLHDYVSEHGSTDPDTGTVEYPGNGEEYVYELEEIAEGIRALATPTAKGANHE